MIPRPIKPQWFQILLALGREDLHGIGIQTEVLRATDGHMRLWPAMLYRSMDTMEREGLLERTTGPEGEDKDERKHYYTLTAAGRARLAEEAEMMGRWVESARDVRAT